MTTSFTPDNDHYQKALAEVSQQNKTAVFDALAAAGITAVTVRFDGEGDSGQIESVDAYAGDQPVAFPQTAIPIHRAHWGESEIELLTLPLHEAIETLCYAFLEQDHDGWENNDGAYGEFEIDVAKRTIDLEFHGRFTDVHTETHSY